MISIYAITGNSEGIVGEITTPFPSGISSYVYKTSRIAGSYNDALRVMPRKVAMNTLACAWIETNGLDDFILDNIKSTDEMGEFQDALNLHGIKWNYRRRAFLSRWIKYSPITFRLLQTRGKWSFRDLVNVAHPITEGVIRKFIKALYGFPYEFDYYPYVFLTGHNNIPLKDISYDLALDLTKWGFPLRKLPPVFRNQDRILTNCFQNIDIDSLRHIERVSSSIVETYLHYFCYNYGISSVTIPYTKNSVHARQIEVVCKSGKRKFQYDCIGSIPESIQGFSKLQSLSAPSSKQAIIISDQDRASDVVYDEEGKKRGKLLTIKNPGQYSLSTLEALQFVI